VPYPIESSLSGVKKALLPDQRLWYRRSFNVPMPVKDQHWLLHFDAVDWEASVLLNGHLLGIHKGGYSAFSFDITPFLQRGENELVVSVWDPTEKSRNAYGKQSLTPHTTWYTATSGIWQTVWLEPVSSVSISSLTLTPNLDKKTLQLTVHANILTKGYSVEATAATKGDPISSIKGAPETDLSLPIFNPHPWSPKDPFLYDLTVRLLYKGRVVDSVRSYFGMRKIEVKKDEHGLDRIFLNGQYIFNLGTLDQGFWPEGCYTAPTDSALFYDILAEKQMGFNTIRKHLKVEPARWYYHCDRLGMLVWQDVPARYPRIDSSTDTKEARAQFEWEMQEEFRQLHNSPAIIMWILFNEDWAIYDKDRLEDWARKTDPSRLLNTNTGSKKNPGLSGDLSVVHHYCYPIMPPRIPGRASILGEFGGITDVIEGHDWIPSKQWGHGEVMPGVDFPWIYEDMMRRVKEYESEGLSGSIFTQPYDVEQEKCGLMTYDRALFKIPVDTVRKINETIVR
jgi:beta-galactosidase/beta-glucuronidase